MKDLGKGHFPWRSMLYVPANVRRYVEKAHLRQADAVILDLEDSIPKADKEAARHLIREGAASCARSGAVLVRINRPLELAVRDIEAAVCSDVTALMLPKIDSAGHLRLLAEVVSAAEAHQGIAEGHTRFIPMVETPAAFGRIFEIAAGHPRNLGLSLGSEDFALALGAEPDAEVLQYPKQQAVAAARAAGIAPVGIIGTVAQYQDLESLRAVIARSMRFGFEGGTCIHPSMIPLLNDGFSPSPEEVERAERLVAAYRDAMRAGRGSVTFEGRMIDVPIVARAERLLARAQRTQRKQGVQQECR